MASYVRAHLLGSDGIITDLASSADRWEAIDEMVGAASAGGLVPAGEIDRVGAAIKRHEQFGSTGMGLGFAFPHAEVESPSIRSYLWVLGRSMAGLNWEALDRHPIHLALMTVAPRGMYAVKYYAKFSQLLLGTLGFYTIPPEILSWELPKLAQFLDHSAQKLFPPMGNASSSSIKGPTRNLVRARVTIGGAALRARFHGEPAMQILGALKPGPGEPQPQVRFQVLKRAINIAGTLVPVASEEPPFDPLVDSVALQGSLAPGTELEVSISVRAPFRVAERLERLLVSGPPGHLFEGSRFESALAMPLEQAPEH
jgi:mannitol/fructose-specific phosphotransferase system IIA component (Ntr-type)